MAMEHFDEKIVPTFRINPQNAIAGSASMISTCDLHGNSSVSPSKILSGSFMPIAGPSYLGVPAGISSPVFGTTHSTPKSRYHTYVDKPLTVKRFDQKFTNKSTDNLHPAEKTFLDSINKSHQILEKTIKRQRRIMRKMQKVSLAMMPKATTVYFLAIDHIPYIKSFFNTLNIYLGNEYAARKNRRARKSCQ